MLGLPWEFWMLYAYAGVVTSWSVYRFSAKGFYASIICIVSGFLWPVALPLHLWAAEDVGKPTVKVSRRVRV